MKYNMNPKIIGWSTILSAFLYAISIIGLIKYVYFDLTDPVTFAESMNTNHSLMLLYGWPGLLATILLLPLVYSVHQKALYSTFSASIIFLCTLFGLIFIVIGYLFHLALTYFHAPFVVGLDESEFETFGLIIKSIIGIQDMFWLGGDLFAFLGIAVLLILVRQIPIPRWLIGIGILGCLSASIGSFSFIPAYKSNLILGMMFMIGFSVFAIWELAVGIAFAMHKSPK